MKYVVTSSGKPDYYELRANIGEVVKIELDFAPWLETRGTNSSTVWSLVKGSLSFTNSGTIATVTLNSAGRSLLTCLVTSSTGEKKKVWLLIKAEDLDNGDPSY